MNDNFRDLIGTLRAKFRTSIVETKVAESYFFMTVQNIGSFAIGLLLYSYTVRTIGVELYGLYVFTSSIITYCVTFVDFGFHIPTAKAVIDNRDDKAALSRIVSRVIEAKLLLIVPIGACLAICVASIDSLREHWPVFVLLFMQPIGQIFSTTWYYWGLKKLGTITVVTLAVRLLSIPLILLLVRGEDDFLRYIAIVSACQFIALVVPLIVAIVRDGLHLHFVGLREVWQHTKECAPFFFNNCFDSIKDATLPIIIGLFLGMRDVAIYNLGDKIIFILLMFCNNINAALYPEFVDKANDEMVRKMTKYEIIIGIVAMAMVAAVGYYAVLLLGGEDMTMAYPIAMILSVRILSYLYIEIKNKFIFIPRGRYINITIRQAFTTVLSVTACYVGLSISPTIIMAASLTAVTYVLEMLFCRYLARRTPYVEYKKST